MKKLALLLCLSFFACAGTQAVKQVGREGKTLKIKRSSDEVFVITVQMLMAEGFMPKQINEKYGFATFEPRTMSIGEFYKTMEIPGTSLVGLSSELSKEINLNCTVKAVDAETSKLTLRAQVFEISTESYNPFSGTTPARGTSKQYSDYYSGEATNLLLRADSRGLWRKKAATAIATRP